MFPYYWIVVFVLELLVIGFFAKTWLCYTAGKKGSDGWALIWFIVAVALLIASIITSGVADQASQQHQNSTDINMPFFK